MKELQNDILDENKSLSSILRKANVLSYLQKSNY
ncbi:hypothetical protein KKB18_11790 [bacterium]|nr:hypothetical protein [bacterium]